MKSPEHMAGILLVLFLGTGLAGNPAKEIMTEAAPSFEDAVSLYYDGDFEESLEAFQSRVDHDAADTRSRLQLSRLLREAGYLREAREHLVILNADPENGRYSLELLKTEVLAGLLPEPVFAGPDSSSAEELFWYGLAVYRKGETAKAGELLNESLRRESYNPGAHYFLGILALGQGNYDSAADHLRLALKQEPNLTRALLPMARTEIARGNLDAAYSYLQRALAVYPGNREAARELRNITERYPDLKEKRDREAGERRVAVKAPKKEQFPEDRETIPAIRIGLAEDTDILHLKTGEAFSLRSADILYQGEQGEILTISHAPDRIIVSRSGGGSIMETAAPVVLNYDSPGATTALFDMEYGSGYYFAGSEDRFYRGQMEFLPKPGGITVINQVNLEEYLYSVVPSEIPAYWPEEALKAQAIAARSYTLANMGRFSSRGFDLMGSVRSASYRGAGNEAERTSAAVDASRGKVLIYDNRPLDAVYSANSGGHTESGESVWRYPSPLQAVNDPAIPERISFLPPEELARWLTDRPPGFSSAPGLHSPSAYRWRSWISAEEIAARLRARGTEVGEIISLTSRGRGISGRVEKILVRGTGGSTEIQGDAIRSVLGSLRSNLFVSEPVLGDGDLPESFVFTGGGWGHGVGMDQSGAAGMAADGWTWEEILAHYYPGTTIKNIYTGKGEQNQTMGPR